MTPPYHPPRGANGTSRTGLTLTELLVSVAIMVVLVAAAVPILRPLSASNKNREAARQIQALFAEARSMAALRGRPVGVMFDTSLDPRVAADVQDRDAVSRLYLAEVPPMFQGVMAGSCVVADVPRVLGDSDPDPPPVMQAYNLSGTVPNPFAYLTFHPSPEAYYLAIQKIPGGAIDPTLDVLIPEGTTFRIRFNGTGPWYDGIRERDPNEDSNQPRVRQLRAIDGTSFGPSARYRIQAAGVAMRDRPTVAPAWFPANERVLTSLYLVQDATSRPLSLGAAIAPPLAKPLKYQIVLPPQRVGTSVLELPRGAVVDLRCSGYGRSDYGLGQSLPGENPVMLFSPNGSIDGFSNIRANGALHLLVGTRKQMALLDQPALINGARPKDDTTGTLTRDTAYGNLRSGSSVWVSINNRTGAVATSDVGPIAAGLNLSGPRQWDGDGLPLNAELARRQAIESAREFANSLNSRGGL